MSNIQINSDVKSIYDKVRAFKHVTKILETIDKKGSYLVKLNCTGVSWEVKVGDVHYFKFKTIQAKLAEEINAYEITEKAASPAVIPKIAPRRVAIAPMASAPNKENIKKAKQKAYAEKYRQKPEVKEKRKAYAKEYYRKKKAEKAALCSPVGI